MYTREIFLIGVVAPAHYLTRWCLYLDISKKIETYLNDAGVGNEQQCDQELGKVTTRYSARADSGVIIMIIGC